uniref:Endoplasmic reticulum lectin 1 n=1 Tax=Schistosoma haematobium TaxID=6185 RepID=A0A095B3Q8_SCHHA
MLFHNTEEDEAKNTDSVDEETLLQPLFTEQPCNVRSEAYWSYELCHNRHIKQFHEERRLEKKIESSRPRILPGTLLSKYVLTLHDINCLDPKMGKDRPSKDNPPSTVTLGEHSYPYYGINYIDGTLCDLNQEHRTATVMYICHESVTGQIVDVSEIRTCQYQVVFATKFLCSNPLYKQKRAHTNPISCHSKNSSPSKPSALVALEAERKKFQSRSFTDLAALLSNAFKSKVKISAKHGKDVLFYQVNPAEDPDDESTSQVDNTKTNVNDDAKNSHDSSSFSDLDVVNQVSSSLKTPSSTLPKINPSIMKSVNDNQVMEFLQGKLCLTGNLGWWTYEICFNKFIRQYHLDANTKKLQEIRLGHWDLDAHLKWFEENNVKKQKSSDSSNRQISLYYGQGDLCTETNKLREVVVESSVFCDLIPLADENDILPLDKV